MSAKNKATNICNSVEIYEDCNPPCQWSGINPNHYLNIERKVLTNIDNINYYLNELNEKKIMIIDKITRHYIIKLLITLSMKTPGLIMFILNKFLTLFKILLNIPQHLAGATIDTIKMFPSPPNMGQCDLDPNLTNNNIKAHNEVGESNLNTIQEQYSEITDEEIDYLRKWIELRIIEENKEMDTSYKGKVYTFFTDKKAKNFYRAFFYDLLMTAIINFVNPLRILPWLGPVLDYTRQIRIAGANIPITLFNVMDCSVISNWIMALVDIFGDLLKMIPIIGLVLKNLQIGYLEEGIMNTRYIKNIYEWVRKNFKKSPEEMDFVTLESNAKAHIDSFKKKKISFKDTAINIIWTIYLGISFGMAHKDEAHPPQLPDQGKTFKQTNGQTHDSVISHIIGGIYYQCFYNAFGVYFVILLHALYDLVCDFVNLIPYLLGVLFIFNLGMRMFKKGNNVNYGLNSTNNESNRINQGYDTNERSNSNKINQGWTNSNGVHYEGFHLNTGGYKKFSRKNKNKKNKTKIKKRGGQLNVLRSRRNILPSYYNPRNTHFRYSLKKPIQNKKSNFDINEIKSVITNLNIDDLEEMISLLDQMVLPKYYKKHGISPSTQMKLDQIYNAFIIMYGSEKDAKEAIAQLIVLRQNNITFESMYEAFNDFKESSIGNADDLDDSNPHFSESTLRFFKKYNIDLTEYPEYQLLNPDVN